MNLVTGNWIPVIFSDGTTQLVGLKTLYEQADKISDLVLTPPQRISIMRLLICITQAALDGPENEAEWLNCEKHIVSESINYLNSRIDKFNLYDDKQPFLQVANCEKLSNASCDKLDFGLAAGNNPTFFDHEAAEGQRKQSDAWIAVMLISYQNFSPGGTIGETKWNNISTGKNSEHAPCVEASPIHTLIIGKNLLQSLWLNMITKKDMDRIPNSHWGAPTWDVDTTSKEQCINANITTSYLGRLVPLSRLILIESKTNLTLANGLPYPKCPASREPSTTVVKKGKGQAEKQGYLSIQLDKHPWRELNSIMTLSQDALQGGAITLNHINSLNLTKLNLVYVWTGGLVADKGKIIDTAEWNFSLPVELVGGTMLSRYSIGVELADSGGDSLEKAISKYLEFAGNDKFQTNPQGGFRKKGKKDWELRKGLLSQARSHYWQALDNSYQILIDTVCDNTKSLDEDWYKNIFKAMHSAFRYACSCDTPRQIQAYAQAESFLKLKKTEKNNENAM